MKRHQLDWAQKGHIPLEQLEIRHDALSHVLKPEHRKKNLFNPAWWHLIEGAEHRWARALNSSQCFAVNLFAPATERPDLAKALFEIVVGTLPQNIPNININVGLEFEHTPSGARDWLGERGHPTQVDVFFTAQNNEKVLGHLLVEVKLTESEFGSCRGTGKDNPKPERCQNAAAIIADPARQCWLKESEGRKYWEIITKGDEAFDFSALEPDEPCPFSGDLYQLMRNHALSKSLKANTEAAWSYFAVCIHPQNQQAQQLKHKIAGSQDALESFRRLAGDKALRTLPPEQVIAATEALYPDTADWAAWMRSRYLLPQG